MTNSAPDAGNGTAHDLVTRLFGELRAEYVSDDDTFSLLRRPSYWAEIVGVRPAFLFGGRGTGKTTVLRGLSYSGQVALTQAPLPEWKHIGVYWRIDSLTVQAFRNAGLGEDVWTRIFSHYFNLVACLKICEFVEWALDEGHIASAITPDAAEEVGLSLHIEDATDIQSLRKGIRRSIVRMEASLNNAADDPFGSLSLLGAPMYGLVTALQAVPEIAGKPIFLLLDEYENLQDYQQRIVNTLVRHAGDTRLTFKVGVRELGLRQHGTLAEEEFISEPADYASVDIARRLVADDFSRFAQEVCGARLSVLAQALSISPVSLEELFPPLSEADEAVLLGAERRVNQALSRTPQTELPASALREFRSLPLAEQWLVVYWQSGHPELRLGDLIADRLQRTKEWDNRRNNYLYASLFTLSTGRGAAKKRYAGWDLLCSVSEGNVRYLLQILEAALRSSIGEKGELPTALSARQQSDALVEVGRKRVYELQGFSNHGRAISRLILALGRLFQVMAAHPEGHAPEVNQFRVTGLEELNPSAEYVRELLRAGVMHAALVRFPGDKRRGISGEVREYDYRPHPIFSAFFQYSHRSKRRLTLTPSQIRSLIETPRKGIDDVLASQNRSPISASDPIPDQLLLLEDFYLDGD